MITINEKISYIPASENPLSADYSHLPFSTGPHWKHIQVEYKKYAFVGDALYSKSKAGNRIYNVTLLKDSIDTIKRIKAQYLLVSHFPGLVRPKDEVIHELETLYNLREKGNPIVSILSEEHV